jgi:hypothetical protein
MSEAIGSKVPFNPTNVGKCMCPKCPVQAKSQCVSSKLTTIAQAVSKSPLSREDIPGQYCSTGTATCTDLDPKQSCMCPGCSIFTQYTLDKGTPVGWYCRDGFAK